MTGAQPQNKWNPISEKTLLDSPFMSIVARLCRSSEDPREHTFYLFKARDWCNIIPITEDGNVVLVKQDRIGIGQHTLEAPGGVVDPTDPSLQAVALRELAEETGYTPLPNARVESLGWSYPNPAIQNNRVHNFIVGPVARSQVQQLDSGEMIEVREVPIAQVIKMLLPNAPQNESIDHALILVGFLGLLLKNPKTADLLTEQLESYSRAPKLNQAKPG